MAMRIMEEGESVGTPAGLVGKGILAGLAGTAVMTAANSRLMPNRLLSRVPSGYAHRNPRYPDEPEAKELPSTQVAALRFFEGMAHRPLNREQTKWAGHLTHFATGAVWGGLFALVAPRRPAIRHGLAWGALAWMVNDNLLLPLLRLADWFPRYPLGVHLRALTAHLVYGAGTAWALARELR